MKAGRSVVSKSRLVPDLWKFLIRKWTESFRRKGHCSRRSRTKELDLDGGVRADTAEEVVLH